MRIAVFAGTFDPITKGHEYVVNKALESFDKVYIVIACNDQKTPFFTTEERREFIKSTFDLNDRVEVFVHDGLMMDFMKEKGLTHYIRGIRNDTDLSYEKKMLDFNKGVYPELNTVFIYSPKTYGKITSTAVREGNESAIRELVPSVIFDKVSTRLSKK